MIRIINDRFELSGADYICVRRLATYFGISYGDMVRRIKTEHIKEKK